LSTSFWRHSVSTRWNNYIFRPGIDPNQRPLVPRDLSWPADDVKFIRQIGDDVLQQLATDPLRIFVAGFSSGGAMCTRVLVWRPRISSRRSPAIPQAFEVHETLVGQRNLCDFSLGTLTTTPRGDKAT
jgi:hypothetical protein